MIRLMKIALAAFAALFCLLYGLQNLMNLSSAYGFVALMVGMTDHVAYPNHIGPAIESSAIIWAMLWIIITLEFVAGGLAAKGAWSMWSARNADDDAFNAAKALAILGTGLAVILWFGIFSAIGGAYFQMWQTEAGDSALRGAFWFSMQNGLVLLIISLRE